jgi:DNA-binding GntR family transcriptional regulator
MKKLIRAKSLSEQVADAVGEEIANGTLKLGQMISETMISEQLGVSRTPVREAFTRLEYKGLLITKPRSGTYVFEADENKRSELFDVSAGMELQGLRLSSQVQQPRFRDEIIQVSEKMSVTFQRDEATYHSLNAEYHELFVQYSGNNLMLEIYDTVQHKIRALSNAGFFREMISESCHAAHMAIAHCVQKNEKREAFKLLSDHMGPSENGI